MSVTPDQKSLTRVGVILLSSTPLELQCKQCKTVWQPGRLSNGRLPTGWWHCPNDPQHTVDWDALAQKPTSISKSKPTDVLGSKFED